MRYITLEIKENDDGLVGFVPTIHNNWFQRNKEVGGYMPSNQVGHDLISHGINETGSFEEELKALGCEIWLSQFYQKYNEMTIFESYNIFANDILSAYLDEYRKPNAFNNIELKKHPKNFNGKEEIRKFFEKAWFHVVLNLSTELELDEDETVLWEQKSDENKESVFSWLAYGYWYAQNKRYKGYDPYDVFLTSKRINDVCQKAKPYFDLGSIGEVWKLSYNLHGKCEINYVGYSNFCEIDWGWNL